MAPKRKRPSPVQAQTQAQAQAQPRATRQTRTTGSVNGDINQSTTKEHLSQSRVVGHTNPITMITSTTPSTSAPSPATVSTGADQAEQGTGHQPDRNIDKVVLGDICFRAWYPSCYPKELLGDFTGSSLRGEKSDKAVSIPNGSVPSGSEEATGAKPQSRRDRDHHPMLDRLYVCPWCFKYSKELVAWWEHVRMCERQGSIPGTKVYSHPKGRRTVLVPSGPVTKPLRGRRGTAGPKMVERVVEDEGEWSVWEVDGANDVVSISYCPFQSWD